MSRTATVVIRKSLATLAEAAPEDGRRLVARNGRKSSATNVAQLRAALRLSWHPIRFSVPLGLSIVSFRSM
jgi:hypothetical protein